MSVLTHPFLPGVINRIWPYLLQLVIKNAGDKGMDAQVENLCDIKGIDSTVKLQRHDYFLDLTY